MESRITTIRPRHSFSGYLLILHDPLMNFKTGGLFDTDNQYSVMRFIPAARKTFIGCNQEGLRHFQLALSILPQATQHNPGKRKYLHVSVMDNHQEVPQFDRICQHPDNLRNGNARTLNTRLTVADAGINRNAFIHGHTLFLL
jgi:hypothetical protein